jgi:hypothetical protein
MKRSHARPLLRSLAAALGTALPCAQAPSVFRAAQHAPAPAVPPLALRPAARARAYWAAR